MAEKENNIFFYGVWGVIGLLILNLGAESATIVNENHAFISGQARLHEAEMILIGQENEVTGLILKWRDPYGARNLILPKS